MSTETVSAHIDDILAHHQRQELYDVLSWWDARGIHLRADLARRALRAVYDGERVGAAERLADKLSREGVSRDDVDGHLSFGRKAMLAASDAHRQRRASASGLHLVPSPEGSAEAMAEPVSKPTAEPGSTPTPGGVTDIAPKDNDDLSQTISLYRNARLPVETRVEQQQYHVLLSALWGRAVSEEEAAAYAASETWESQGICGQTDPEAFFPEKGGSTREAKRICMSCGVSEECLRAALANDERYGIWGGKSERERRRLNIRAV